MKKIWLLLFLGQLVCAGKLAFDPVTQFHMYKGYLNQFYAEIKCASNKKRLQDLAVQIGAIVEKFLGDISYLENGTYWPELRALQANLLSCQQECKDKIGSWHYNRMYDNVLDELVSTQI